MTTLVLDADGYEVTPELVIEAYRQRCFPMAEERDGQLRWFRPPVRAVITWDAWKIPDSLRKRLAQQPFRITVNTDFAAVIAACAQRQTTWISFDVERLYRDLHERGFAHSVEAWNAAGELVGGLYGLVVGGIFCGESMFHRANDAAKICVVHLVDRLQRNGFTLLDCQQQTPHMARFGAHEISDRTYEGLVRTAQQSRPFP